VVVSSKDGRTAVEDWVLRLLMILLLLLLEEMGHVLLQCFDIDHFDITFWQKLIDFDHPPNVTSIGRW
jgi:hypothetical protein